jgi:hypothetical protein
MTTKTITHKSSSILAEAMDVLLTHLGPKKTAELWHVIAPPGGTISNSASSYSQARMCTPSSWKRSGLTGSSHVSDHTKNTQQQQSLLAEAFSV